MNKFHATSVQNVPLGVSVKLEKSIVRMTRLKTGRFVIGSLMCLAISTHPTFARQFELLQSTVPRRYPSTGRRGSVFLRTLMVLLVSVLYFRKEQQQVSLWNYLRTRATLVTDKRSVSGGSIMCGAACVFWFSRAKYVSLGDAVKELLFLRQVWRLMLPDKEMHQGAVQLSQNPSPNSNSELINVRHHLFRGFVCQGGILVNHVPSEYQYAEILTKH